MGIERTVREGFATDKILVSNGYRGCDWLSRTQYTTRSNVAGATIVAKTIGTIQVTTSNIMWRHHEIAAARSTATCCQDALMTSALYQFSRQIPHVLKLLLFSSFCPSSSLTVKLLHQCTNLLGSRRFAGWICCLLQTVHSDKEKGQQDIVVSHRRFCCAPF